MKLFAQRKGQHPKLSTSPERIRVNTLGVKEQIKNAMSKAVRLSAVRVALYELSGTALRELEL